MKTAYKYISLLLFSGLILFLYTIITSSNTSIVNGSPKAMNLNGVIPCLSGAINSKGFSITDIALNLFPVLKKLN